MPGGIGIGDIAVIFVGKSATDDAKIDDGRASVDGVEKWGGETVDGVVIAVEGAAEVSDGRPGRVYGDALGQTIVAGGIRGEVINQVPGRCNVLAGGVGLVGQLSTLSSLPSPSVSSQASPTKRLP